VRDVVSSGLLAMLADVLRADDDGWPFASAMPGRCGPFAVLADGTGVELPVAVFVLVHVSLLNVCGDNK